VNTARVKLGVLVWPQYTDWPSLRDAGETVDRLGFDSLWTWDHLYPIVGSPEGPEFEGYTTLAAWATLTRRATLGLLVGANTFRNPALAVKMATTLDHISGGRAILGLGGAWFELEHRVFGFDFGSSTGERLDWLDEAAMIVRAMLDGGPASGRAVYRADAVRNNPPPLQRRLPFLIGGAGERKTLATVARYADIWNVGGDVETVRHKDEVLRRWCREVGRNSDEIERTLLPGIAVIRRTEREVKQVVGHIRRTNRGWEEEPEQAGTPEQIVERLSPYLGIGFRSMHFDFPAPFDRETLELLSSEVREGLSAHL
jgi:alkanesulfonate monooxygenase SsuD/methylene tetrahydromethanopterin reductase-like flavin-dependent oxidoreductase (luciferase family)